MKRISIFYSILVCILCLGITSCDKEDKQIIEPISITIKNDFSTRHPFNEITSFQQYGDGSFQIDFIDDNKNTGSSWYVNGAWQMTHTKISDINQITPEAKVSFYRSEYAFADIKEIYKTDREGIEKSLYTFYFQFPYKSTDNVEHYVFINDDGLFLSTFTWVPNDPTWFRQLPKENFEFIAKKYNNAEVRGFVNNGGIYEYFILHDDTIKYVSFDGRNPSTPIYWKETRYELDKDVKIPDNVAKQLKKVDPDFTYTNIYYIESNEGNRYLFEDRKRDNNLGYYISENINPEE